jgi:signal transduction histidine kinase
MFSLPKPSAESGFSVVVYAMIALATATFVLARHEDLPQWRFIGTLVSLGALAVLYSLPDDTSRNRNQNLRLRPVLLLLASGGLVLFINGLGLQSGLSFLPFLLFLVVGHAFTNFPIAFAITVSGGLLLLWMIGLNIVYQTPVAEVIASGASVLVGMVFTAMFSLLTTLYREESARTSQLLRELQQTYDALSAAQEQQKSFAAAEERVQIARDIHDGLGHHLTALNVQLQAAAKLLERDPERAAQAINTCREVAQAALREVRFSVASLRRTPLDGTSLDEATSALVQEFGKVSPLNTSFNVNGKPIPLTPAAALTLYRTAQEGLTNAQKYSDGTTATVTLTYAPTGVSMAVANDGPVVTTTGEGFGLIGLRERATQLNGTLHADPQPRGGFLLTLNLPLHSIQ